MNRSEAETRRLPARLLLSEADTQPLHATQLLRRDEVETWGDTTPSLAPAATRSTALGSCGRCLRLVAETDASSCAGCGGLLHDSCRRGSCSGCAAPRHAPAERPTPNLPWLAALALGWGSLLAVTLLGPAVLVVLALLGVALVSRYHPRWGVPR